MNALGWRLLARLRLANYWLVAQIARACLAVLRLLPPDRALGVADRFARRVGPWFGRHRTAIENLTLAYPEKNGAEIEAIASDMWGNMARLAVEYVFLDELFDYSPADVEPGRVEIVGNHIFDRIAAERKPHIFFTGHIGNFELLPVCAAAYQMQVTALFRPPNNPYIAEYVFKTRRSSMGGLLASKRGAALGLARILEQGGNIGLLVDQKFANGIATSFFGRQCETSPLLPKLARQYDCDVYPAHCVRLPGNRFRAELTEAIAPVRGADGKIDAAGTTQAIMNVIEGWIREYPEQWLWQHRRWR